MICPKCKSEMLGLNGPPFCANCAPVRKPESGGDVHPPLESENVLGELLAMLKWLVSFHQPGDARASVDAEPMNQARRLIERIEAGGAPGNFERLVATVVGSSAALEGRKLISNPFPVNSVLHTDWVKAWAKTSEEMNSRPL